MTLKTPYSPLFCYPWTSAVQALASLPAAASFALLVYASYDLTFPVDLSRILIEEFGRRGLPHQVRVLPCGHYSTGIAPFKFLDAYLLTSYLRRAL